MTISESYYIKPGTKDIKRWGLLLCEALSGADDLKREVSGYLLEAFLSAAILERVRFDINGWLHELYDFFKGGSSTDLLNALGERFIPPEFKDSLPEHLVCEVNHKKLMRFIEALYLSPDNRPYDFSDLSLDLIGASYLAHYEEGGQKAMGAFYTPPEIVEFIIGKTIGIKLKEDGCDPIKVLDPACGSGVFLTSVFERFIKKTSENNRYATKRIIITGVDKDLRALRIAYKNLSFVALKHYSEKRAKGQYKIDLIRNDFFNLNGGLKEGFDIIIGNPPWVSLKGRHKQGARDDEYLMKIARELGCDGYRPNLFEAFLRNSLRLLKEGGLLGFLVPNSMASNLQFEKLREETLTKYNMRYIWLDIPFPKVVGEGMVCVIQKGGKPSPVKIAAYPSRKFESRKPQELLSAPGKAFSFEIPKFRDILKKIEENSCRLDSLAKTQVGFIAKSGKVKAAPYSEDCEKVLKGRDITKYAIMGAHYFEFVKDNLAGGTQDEKKLRVFPKLLVRKTGSDIQAAFTEEPLPAEQSLYFVYGADRETLLFLLAVINSPPLEVYYRNIAVTNRNSTPQLKKARLDALPIPQASREAKISLVKKAEAMISLAGKFCSLESGGGDKEELLHKIIELDALIENEVCSLYNLEAKEADIVLKEASSLKRKFKRCLIN